MKRAALLVAAACGLRFAAAADPATGWTQLPPLPDPLGVAGAFAGVSGDALIVAGGANFPDGMPWAGGKKAWLDRVWVLEKPDGAWRDAGRLPGARAYGVSVTTADGLVCIGGSDARAHHAEVWRLSWNGGMLRVETLPPLPVRLANAAGAELGGTIYVACGAEEPGEQVASARFFALDLPAGWRELDPLPAKPRIMPVAAALNGVFYLFGGASLEAREGKVARSYLREAWRFKTAEGWKPAADLPHALAAAPSPALSSDGSRLLIAGGDDGTQVGFQPVEQHPGFARGILAYDPRRDAWTRAGETPAPRANATAVRWRGRFIIPSGEVRPGVRSPQVWSFLPP
jgi:N-acetylneuraminic acid mutarotase